MTREYFPLYRGVEDEYGEPFYTSPATDTFKPPPEERARIWSEVLAELTKAGEEIDRADRASKQAAKAYWDRIGFKSRLE